MRRLFLLIPGLFLSGCIQMSVFMPPPHWQTYQSEPFGLSVDCPYPLTFHEKKIPESKGRWGRWLTGKAVIPDTLFMLNVSSYLSPDADVPTNAQQLINNYINSLKQPINRELQWKAVPVQCSGMPATLLTGSYLYVYDKICFSNLILIKPGQTFSASVFYGDAQKYGPIADQVLQSVKLGLKIP